MGLALDHNRIRGLRELRGARVAASLGLAALALASFGSLGGCSAVAPTVSNDLPQAGVTFYGTLDAGVARRSR